MTHPPGLRILMAQDAVARSGLYAGAGAPALCVNADGVPAQQRRRAMQRVAS
jgi:hypothetical protein